MAFSCNTTYMPLAFSVYQVNETALTDLLYEFGFGAPTGISYLVEETGIVPDDAWLAENGRGGYSGFEQVQLAIGQGAFLGTPLQLANAYAAIGNGGTLWTPRILTAATLPDGTVVEEVEPTVAHQISVAAADLAFVTDTLEAVTTLSYGTATAAFAGFGIPVAGQVGHRRDRHAGSARLVPRLRAGRRSHHQRRDDPALHPARHRRVGRRATRAPRHGHPLRATDAGVALRRTRASG